MQIPEMFTTAGFYYFGIADRVNCLFYDRGLRNWEPNGDAWREHDRWFRTCGYFWFCKEDGKIKGTKHRFSPPGAQVTDTLGTSTPKVAKPKMEYCNCLLGGAGKQVERNLSNITLEIDFNHWNENNTVQSFKKWCSNVTIRQQLLAKLGFYYTGTGDRVQCAPQVLAELGFYYTCSDDQVKCAPQVLAKLGFYYTGSDDRVQCAPQVLAELGFYYTGTDDQLQCAPHLLPELGFNDTGSDDWVQCAPQVLVELGFDYTGSDDQFQCEPQLLAELGFYYTGTDDQVQYTPQVLAELGFYYTGTDDQVQYTPQVLAELGFDYTGTDDRFQCAPQLLAELGFYYTGTDDRFQCAPQVLAKLGFYYTGPDDRVQCAPQVLAELGFYYTGRDDRVQFAFCRVIVWNWEAGDKRDAAPGSHVIQCPFTLVNIPMGNDNETPSGLTVFSTITRHTLEMYTTGFSDTVRDLEEEIQKSKEEITCKVCLDEEVNIMFLPCGHFVCDKCDPAMRCCPICR